MAGRIPRDFIEDLVARADIVEVIDSRVRLKKAGKNYQACCPFHNEKTPSFSVAPDKQFYYCFGCGAKGNALGFLMEYERLEFVEAVEELASLYGLEVPREKSEYSANSSEYKQQKTSDYDLMRNVAEFYATQLTKHQNSQTVIDYLKQRGLSGEVVKAWGIGYAPQEWDSLLRHFGNDSQQRQRLMDLKLVNQNDNQRQYDFFRHRIMFPILDKRGRVIAFGGRRIDEQGPKYLNSPETRIFHKSNELYGLFQARQHHRQLVRVLVVEGYMDVVALSQFDITYAVAALGTATTTEHIQTLFKSTNEVVCCYDGDNAGRTAAWRALENALPCLKDGVIMKFLFLPEGEDPDTLIRKEGKQAFENRINAATPLSKFFFNTMLERHSASSIESRAALKAEAEPLINEIQAHNQKEMLMRELSRICGETDKYILDLDSKKAKQYTNNPNGQFGKLKVSLSPVRHMLRLLLEQPALAAKYPKARLTNLTTLNVSGIQTLIELHTYCLKRPDAVTAVIMEAFRDHPHYRHLFNLLNTPLPENTSLDTEYIDCFKSLLKQYLNQRLDDLERLEKLHGLTDAQQQELSVLLSRKANI